MIKKLYLAGPLFTSAELAWNVLVAEDLKKLGFEVWLPQDKKPIINTAEEIFRKDIEGINWADAVLANLDGADPDSGTAWEMGYAYASKKPVFWYRTDKRVVPEGLEETNLMLTQSGHKVTEWKDILHYVD